jgi:hypothetical protein
MLNYRVPVLIEGAARVEYPQGKAAGDYTGGLLWEAEAGVCANTPILLPPPGAAPERNRSSSRTPDRVAGRC